MLGSLRAAMAAAAGGEALECLGLEGGNVLRRIMKLLAERPREFIIVPVPEGAAAAAMDSSWTPCMRAASGAGQAEELEPAPAVQKEMVLPVPLELAALLPCSRGDAVQRGMGSCRKKGPLQRRRGAGRSGPSSQQPSSRDGQPQGQARPEEAAEAERGDPLRPKQAPGKSQGRQCDWQVAKGRGRTRWEAALAAQRLSQRVFEQQRRQQRREEAVARLQSWFRGRQQYRAAAAVQIQAWIRGAAVRGRLPVPAQLMTLPEARPAQAERGGVDGPCAEPDDMRVLREATMEADRERQEAVLAMQPVLDAVDRVLGKRSVECMDGHIQMRAVLAGAACHYCRREPRACDVSLACGARGCTFVACVSRCSPPGVRNVVEAVKCKYGMGGFEDHMKPKYSKEVLGLGPEGAVPGKRELHVRTVEDVEMRAAGAAAQGGLGV